MADVIYIVLSQLGAMNGRRYMIMQMMGVSRAWREGALHYLRDQREAMITQIRTAPLREILCSTGLNRSFAPCSCGGQHRALVSAVFDRWTCSVCGIVTRCPSRAYCVICQHHVCSGCFHYTTGGDTICDKHRCKCGRLARIVETKTRRLFCVEHYKACRDCGYILDCGKQLVAGRCYKCAYRVCRFCTSRIVTREGNYYVCSSHIGSCNSCGTRRAGRRFTRGMCYACSSVDA